MSQIDRIKREITCRQVAEEAGLKLKPDGDRLVASCPVHGTDTTPSLTIYEDPARGWFCFGCDRGGSVLDLYALLHDTDFAGAVEALTRGLTPSRPPASRPPASRESLRGLWPFNIPCAEVYEYPGGYEVRFKDPKTGRKRSSLCRINEAGEIVHGLAAGGYHRGRDGSWRRVGRRGAPPGATVVELEGASLGLYRPDVWRSGGDEWILLTEGPKDAEAAIRLGLRATTPAGGAHGMKPGDAERLRGLRVAVVPDNDEPGMKAAEKRADMLYGLAAEVRVLGPLGGRPGSGFDLSDFIADRRRRGVDDRTIAAGLREMIASTPIHHPRSTQGKKEDEENEFDETCTDRANAERYVAGHGDRFLYCRDFNSWLVWDGAHYVRDVRSAAERAADDVVGMIFEEAGRAAGKRAAMLNRHAVKTCSAHRQAAILKLVRHHPRVAVAPQDFDIDPFVLNLPSGLLDLRTSELKPHGRPRPRVMQLAGADFDPDARCPRWERFLEEVFVDAEGRSDHDLIAFIRRAVGYSLTGDVGEGCMFLLYGEGSNGKSVMLNVLTRLLGGYSRTMQFDTLLDQRFGGGQNNPDVADLMGRRFAVASESGPNARWKESLVKMLTGGDQVTAARKYENPLTFKPTHKLWLSANHPPRTCDTTTSWWRRVKMIPFRMLFLPEAELGRERPLRRPRVNGLEEELLLELPGILNWALEGCREWRRSGLGSCAAVDGATEEYRMSQDLLGPFLEDCCVAEEGAFETSKDLRRTYEAYCREHGEEPMAARTFGRLLAEHSFHAERRRVGGAQTRVWEGLRLRADLDRSLDRRDLAF